MTEQLTFWQVVGQYTWMALPFLLVQFSGAFKFVHMLQLNSYKNDRYFGWIEKNLKALINPFGIILAVVLFDFLRRNSSHQYMFTSFVLIFVVYGIAALTMAKLILGRPKKKPLVYTGRVVRIIVTMVICTAAFYFVVAACLAIDSFVIDRGYLLCTFALMYLLALFPVAAFLPMVANILNMPIEKAIKQKFVKQAREKLESAPSLIRVGVTGSYGKTSTKYILKEMLNQKYQTLMTPESYNTTLGVTRAVNEGLNGMTEAFVCEMGAKALGDIKEICDLVHPKYGIITAVGVAHLENFKSLETTRAAKFELAYALPDDGVAFLNMDSEELAKENYSRPHRTYGMKEGANYDFTAKDIYFDESGTTFTLCKKSGEELEIKTKLLGRHNVLNILGAASCAYELGVSLEEIREAANRILPVPHRLELKSEKGDHLVIDDAFNSNPDGAYEALSVLSCFKDRQRILITPGMVELGEREFEENKKFGLQAASCCDIIIGVGSQRSIPIIEGAIEGGFSKDNVHTAKNLVEALTIMRSKITGPSVLLLENDLPDSYKK